MKRRMLITWAAIALLAIPVLAQAPAPATPPKPASAAKRPAKPAAAPSLADKLVRMIKLKMPDASIVAAAGNAASTLTADDLIRLKEAGASDALLVQLSSGAAPQAATPAPSAPVDAKPAAAEAAPTYNSNLSAIQCEVPAGQRKRIIAIKNFEFGAVKTGEQAVLDTQGAIGKGMTALAVKRIQEAGKFRVVERENIDTILKEQDFGASNRTKKGTQAKIGNVLGADAILLGTITVFGRDDKKKSVGGFGGSRWTNFGGMKIKMGEDKAVVAVSYRLIDAETSETIAADEARGESKRKSNAVDLGAWSRGSGGGGSFDMTSSNFAQTIIGEATIDCMDKLMAALNNKETAIRLRSLDIDARVAEISGPQIYISSGSNDGVQKCDRFEVSKVVKEVHDPVTKEVLDLQLEKVGDLVVTEVRERMAIGLFNGTSAPQIGFAVRKVPTQAAAKQ